ncbi:MAG: GNAT family N-acetyltransferase [Betaproteobacteria bacterium]
MFTFELSAKFLSDEETELLNAGLGYFNLDKSIWKVFACLFRSTTKGTTPLVLRVYENGTLSGAAIIIECRRYGRALFRNRFLAGVMDLLGIPFHLWIKFGCCMDMMSNPGFVTDPARAGELHAAMVRYLQSHTFLAVIYDFTRNSSQHPGAAVLPSLPHAGIATAGMSSVTDYLKEHKSLKRKLSTFRNNGGTIDIIRGALNSGDVESLRRCFLSTADKSVFYLPYQDLYLAAALTTSSAQLDSVYHFVARLNGQFIGYQAAIKTGSCLNALHGAFDRTLRTTHHAYDLLFLKMVEFAVENRLTSIDFGAVLNETKQRMVNQVTEMSYFLGSRYGLVQWFFSAFLKVTRIQGREQMRFRSTEQGKENQG